MAKRILLVILTALIAAAVWAIITYGRPATLVEVPGVVRDLITAAEGLYWVEVPAELGKDQVTVRFLPRGRHAQPSTILSAYDIRSLVYHEGQLYALTETGPGEATGQLVRFGSSGPPTVLMEGLRSPQGLLVAQSSVTWTEARPASVAGVAHVPVMGPLTVLRSAPLQAGRPVTEPAPRLLAVIESTGGHFTGQLLGARAGHLFWTERMAENMPAERTFCRGADLAGGEPRTLGVAHGPHVAVLGTDCAFWTDRSDELAKPTSGCTVWRCDLAGGEPRKLTDWLPPTGLLAADGDRAYYGGGGWLWAVPGRLDRPRVLRKWGVPTPDALSVCGGLVEGASGTPGGPGKPGKHQIVRLALWPQGFVTYLAPGMAARVAGRRLAAQ